MPSTCTILYSFRGCQERKTIGCACSHRWVALCYSCDLTKKGTHCRSRLAYLTKKKPFREIPKHTSNYALTRCLGAICTPKTLCSLQKRGAQTTLPLQESLHFLTCSWQNLSSLQKRGAQTTLPLQESLHFLTCSWQNLSSLSGAAI
jgi:hypothetical protein